MLGLEEQAQQAAMLTAVKLPPPLDSLREGDLFDRDGSPVPLAEIAKKKVVLLYFGAACCPPCRAFSPVLSSFAAHHPRNSEFAVLFVSADHSEQAMAAFAKGKYFTSIRYDAPGRRGIGNAMGISMYPSLFVINGQTGETLTTWGRSLLQTVRFQGNSLGEFELILGSYMFRLEMAQDGVMESWLKGESGSKSTSNLPFACD